MSLLSRPKPLILQKACPDDLQPAGFDQFLAELAALSEAQMADRKLMDALNNKYDIINLGGVPPQP